MFPVPLPPFVQFGNERIRRPALGGDFIFHGNRGSIINGSLSQRIQLRVFQLLREQLGHDPVNFPLDLFEPFFEFPDFFLP